METQRNEQQAALGFGGMIPVSAVLHTVSKRLEAVFLARELPMPQEYDAFLAELERRLPGYDIDLRVRMEAGALFAQGARLLAAWAELMPTLRVQLYAAVPGFTRDTLVLRAAKGDAPLLETGADAMKDYIARLTGEQPRIVIQPDETLPPAAGKEKPEPSEKAAPRPAAPTEAPRRRAKRPLAGTIQKKPEPVPMGELNEFSGRVTVEGYLVRKELREIRGGQKKLLLFALTDYTNTVTCKLFLPKEAGDKLFSALDKIEKNESALFARGEYLLDQYAREFCLQVSDLFESEREKRMDRAEKKRVELHLHTQLSTMDATTDVEALMRTAKRWGHTAVAVTDHGVVQAYPDAYKAARNAGIKLIYGMEGYLLPDCEPVSSEAAFAAVELETEDGPESRRVRIRAEHAEEGTPPRRFEVSFDTALPGKEPGKEPSETLLRGGDDSPAEGRQGEALRALSEFLAHRILLVYDAQQAEWLWRLAREQAVSLPRQAVPVGQLAKYLLRSLKEHDFLSVAAHLKVSTLTEVFFALRRNCPATIGALTPQLAQSLAQKPSTNHIILLARNPQGLKNLYKLVSYSHLDYFYRRPRIPRSLLMLHREGLIVGSACEQGEVFQAVAAKESEERLAELASFYDYLEIQPIGNNAFMVRSGLAGGEDDLREFNQTVYALGKRIGRPVVATGDVHFLNPEDAQFRRILMDFQDYPDADEQAPLFYRTTEEMLREFAYLGDGAQEVVVDAPARIADRCEPMQLFPDKTFAPKIPGADEELERLVMHTARAVYGDPLPEIVRSRIEKELGAIIRHGFAVLYYTAHKLVAKSLEDGYLVGSRGSVGSSFAATMAGITEVNPLPPHYVCEACKYSDFEVDRGKYACGFDMPDRVCPRCGAGLKKDGYDILFEVFLGFRGEKVPDIDLNFSGEYQPHAHRYTEELFGAEYVFRAGTISAIKDKTARAMVRGYYEKRGITVSRMEIERMIQGCSGVKRTTGQHPGGIVVLPKDLEIFDFTPIQYPADSRNSGVITTHFDFNSMHDTLVKLDILGHDDPTMLRMLENLTGLDPRRIPLDDPETMSIFSSTGALNMDEKALRSAVGTYGVPEFGTGFVRQMLLDTLPKTMEELVRIAGLSHGTDVWLNNAQELIRAKQATLGEVISARDDIMNYLIQKGMEPGTAFKIMENVRKGKGLTPDMEASMVSCGAPQWYIDSCRKIQYMFPRAHAAAYVMMSFRIAYYKVHHPLAFYAAYFSVRCEGFDIGRAAGGADKVRAEITEIERQGKEAEKQGKEASNTEKNLATILEVVLEMNLRGIPLLTVDLKRSAAEEFLIEDGALRPPFCALPGLGRNAAHSLVAAREAAEFISVEDLRLRAKISQTMIQAFGELGALRGLPQSNQLSLF